MGHHQIVFFGSDCVCIMQQTCDELGHRGFYPTHYIIANHFWRPVLNKDLT